MTRLRVSWEPPGLGQAERAGEPAGGERATGPGGPGMLGRGFCAPGRQRAPPDGAQVSHTV